MNKKVMVSHIKSVSRSEYKSFARAVIPNMLDFFNVITGEVDMLASADCIFAMCQQKYIAGDCQIEAIDILANHGLGATVFVKLKDAEKMVTRHNGKIFIPDLTYKVTLTGNIKSIKKIFERFYVAPAIPIYNEPAAGV